MALSGFAFVHGHGSRLVVIPPKNARATTGNGKLNIVVNGRAAKRDLLYVFNELGGPNQCAGSLGAQLQYSNQVQESFYKYSVHGPFHKTTTWYAPPDPGKWGACAYLATQQKSDILHRFILYRVTAPPVGHLSISLPQDAQAGQQYVVTVSGSAAKTDGLWIYQGYKHCLGWYAFHDSTYGDHHPDYKKFVVHGSFSERTLWTEGASGNYRACVYLAETNKYPQRVLSKFPGYTIH